jgi:hypothetical protein
MRSLGQKRLRACAHTEDSGGAGKTFELNRALFLVLTRKISSDLLPHFEKMETKIMQKATKQRVKVIRRRAMQEGHVASLPLALRFPRPGPSRTATRVTRLLHKI